MAKSEKALSFLAFLIFTTSSVVIAKACKTVYVESQPLNEVQVTAQKRYEPGSLQWRIQQCQHLIRTESGEIQTGRLGEFMDCRDKARGDL